MEHFKKNINAVEIYLRTRIVEMDGKKVASCNQETDEWLLYKSATLVESKVKDSMDLWLSKREAKDPPSESEWVRTRAQQVSPLFHQDASNLSQPSAALSTISDGAQFSGRLTAETTTKQMQDSIVYHKNTRGLSKDDRLGELMEELEGLEWTVITINETMRCHKREV